MRRLIQIILLSMLVPVGWAAAPLPQVDVYKNPSCGCCQAWIDHLRANGFTVIAHDTADVGSTRRALGMPERYGSCHTAKLGSYVIEGHVPASDIKRLLRDKPLARGLAVPGMPQSAPGMDDPRGIPYAVLLVNRDDSTTVYARH